MNLWITSLLLMASWPAFAANKLKHEHPERPFTCEEVLVSNFKFIPSGREQEVFPQFIKVASEYIKPGGIFERLNVSAPQQVLHFMPGADVNTIGSVNGMPIASWYDGQRVANLNRKGLLYEIVISGEDEHYGYYRDDNNLQEQVSIFFHATAGHNHFSHNSRYPHFRSSNRIQEAYELSTYMDRMRVEVGHDDVSLWYQFLLSLNMAQDYIGAQYQTPNDLKIKPPQRNAKGQMEKTAFQPTRNVLQAFVANLPADAPDWKREIARRFERLHRFGPGMANTKIMNEGYATLMQIILPKHGPMSSFSDAIHYCCLLHGVTQKNLQNPYWLGLEAWKNVYAKFLKRPEIASLDSWEKKDAAFIKYATVEIIGVMNDEMFLNFSLDSQWVSQENLALTRAYTEEEYREALQQGKLTPPQVQDPKKNWPYVIVTRDPAQIRRSLLNQVKGFHYQFASPYVVDMNDNGTVALEMKDSVGRQVALDRRSLAESLFVLAQIQERPVSIESTFDLPDGKPVSDDDDEDERFFNSFAPPTLKKTRVRVTVSPDGKVVAEEVLRDGSSAPVNLPATDLHFDPVKHKPEYRPLPDLAKSLSDFVQGYIFNLSIGDAPAAGDDTFKTANQLKMLDETVNSILEGASLHLQMNIPTAPRALIEYQNFLNKRLEGALREAIHGRGRLQRRMNGVRIEAMPRVPWFQFDRSSLSQEIQRTPNLPLPKRIEMRNHVDLNFRPGDFTDVGPVDGREGDIKWGPKPNSGNGSGDPDQDGDPSDKPGQDPGGNDPSDEGGERIFEEVSLEAYAEALAEEITLPNLRPKAGRDTRKDDEISGHRHRTAGMSVNRQIIRNAFRRGFPTPEELKNGSDAFDSSGIIRRGLQRLKKEQDWVVRDFEPKKNPDTNAVVFFQMDMSGSMERFKKTAKQALFDLRAMLLRRYKSVTFVYITFNDKAHVFTNPEEFFRFKPNGGTRYARSFEKVIELYEQFPSASWDRFPIVVGDMDESLAAEERDGFEAMKAGAQFTSILKVHEHQSGWDDLTNYLKEQAQGDDFVGYAEVIPSDTYTPLIFREMFKNAKP